MSEIANPYRGWHFLPADGCLRHTTPRVRVVAGGTYRVDGPVVVGARGLFASARAIDALHYAASRVTSRQTDRPIVCRVLLRDEIMPYEKSSVVGAIATERHVLAMAEAPDVLHEFACRCAADVLPLIEDSRSRCARAIATKRRWLRNEATDRELASAASLVATYAYTTARGSVWSAADDISARAAWEAAFFAAGATADNASCSLDAALTKYNTWLEEMLFALLGPDPADPS